MKVRQLARRKRRDPRATPRAQRETSPGRGFWFTAAAVTTVALAGGTLAGPRLGEEIARLLRSRPFHARTIAVVGARRLSPAAVAQAANVSSRSPLVDIDVDAVAGRVAALPEVASARALRLPPDRLVVGVTERVARGVAAAGPGGVPYLVCDEGVAFAPAEGREARQLPRLSAPGKHTPGEATEALALAARAAAAAAGSGFAVAGVEVQDGDALLRLRSLPIEVLLGPAPHADALTRLVQLVARRPDLVEGATAIDVRFADRAVLRGDDAPGGAQQEATVRGSAAASRRPAAGQSAAGHDRG